jgi:hypothetical protein
MFKQGAFPDAAFTCDREDHERIITEKVLFKLPHLFATSYEILLAAAVAHLFARCWLFIIH